MVAQNKNPRNRRLGAYPSEYEVLRGKSADELVRIMNGLPGRIKAAGSIINPERRKKALDKLRGESTMLQNVLKEVVGSP